jgi:hypothetical protein
MFMECACRRHARIAVRAAYSTRMSVATSRAHARSCPGDCEGSMFGGGQSSLCRCSRAHALSNSAARWRDRTRVRFQDLVACRAVMSPATNLFIARAWTVHCSTLDLARRSGSSTASSASMQPCNWSDRPGSGRPGVREDRAPMRPGSSPPPPAPGFGETIIQATARSVTTTAVPPTSDATSRSSTRSSPPRENVIGMSSSVRPRSVRGHPHKGGSTACP